MKRTTRHAALAAGAAAWILFAGPARAQLTVTEQVRFHRGEAPRPFAWETATPESQGMSGPKLAALKDELAARRTTGFLVLRNDKIVYEWYAPGHSATQPHYTASAAKGLVGGVAFAAVMSDGRVRPEDRVARFVPRWKDDPRKAKVELRHLGSHTSGLDDAEADGLPHDRLTGWKGDFWKRRPPPDDPFTIARDRVPLVDEPGTKERYSNPGIAMLTYALTAALRDAPQKDVRTLLRERVMRPIGVPDNEWSVGYGQTFTVGGLPLVAAWGGGGYSARASARVGRLLLRGGDWDGTRVLGREAVRQATTAPADLPGDGAIGWWANRRGRHPKLPKDAYWAAGAGDQYVLVVPSLNLVVVRNGDALFPTPARDKNAGARLLFDGIMDAVTR